MAIYIPSLLLRHFCAQFILDFNRNNNQQPNKASWRSLLLLGILFGLTQSSAEDQTTYFRTPFLSVEKNVLLHRSYDACNYDPE